MNRDYANVAVACRSDVQVNSSATVESSTSVEVVLGACTYILIIGSRLEMKRPCSLEYQCQEKSLFALGCQISLELFDDPSADQQARHNEDLARLLYRLCGTKLYSGYKVIEF